MVSVEKLYQLAQLAESSYGDFRRTEKNALLKDTLNNDMFSNAQADAFLLNWSESSHKPNTDTGFSATLFESKENVGNFTLAFRGTEFEVTPPGQQLIDDVLITDVFGIALRGAAFGQIVDMYNYWQQLVTPVVAYYQQAKPA